VVLKLGNFWGEIRQAEVLAIAAPTSYENDNEDD
jgi:hypothetical protein